MQINKKILLKNISFFIINIFAFIGKQRNKETIISIKPYCYFFNFYMTKFLHF